MYIYSPIAHCPDRAIGSIPMAQDFDLYTVLYDSSNYVPNAPTYSAVYTAPAGRATYGGTGVYITVLNEPILVNNKYVNAIAPIVATWQLDAIPIIAKAKIYAAASYGSSIGECFVSRLPLFNVVFDPKFAYGYVSSVECTEWAYINAPTVTNSEYYYDYPVDHGIVHFFTSTKCDTVKSGSLTVGADTLTHYCGRNLNAGYVDLSARVSGADNFECTAPGIVKPIANDLIFGEHVRFPACIGSLAFRPRTGQLLALQGGSNLHVLKFSPTAITTSLKNNDATTYTTLPYISVDNNLGEYGVSLQKCATFLVRKLKKYSISVKAIQKNPSGCGTLATQCVQHSTLKAFACTERYGIVFSFKLFQSGNIYKMYYNFKAVTEIIPVSRIHRYNTYPWQQSGTLCSGVSQLYATAQLAVDAMNSTAMSSIAALRGGVITRTNAFDSGIINIDYNTEVAIDKSYTSGKQLHFRLKFSATGKIEYLNITLDDLTLGTDEQGRYKGQWL